jgi:hypothetical protein
LKLPDEILEFVNLDELTFFKLLPKKAEVGTVDPAPEPFKASCIKLC